MAVKGTWPIERILCPCAGLSLCRVRPRVGVRTAVARQLCTDGRVHCWRSRVCRKPWRHVAQRLGAVSHLFSPALSVILAFPPPRTWSWWLYWHVTSWQACRSPLRSARCLQTALKVCFSFHNTIKKKNWYYVCRLCVWHCGQWVLPASVLQKPVS